MELCDATAVELLDLYRSGEASPVEVLRSCQNRTDKVNPAVNAIVCEDRDAALASARLAEDAWRRGEPTGPLCGIPLAVKDTHVTGGLRTTFGSPQFRDWIPEKDQNFVATLRVAGAVITGKTNVPEWAAGANSRNPVYGATGNPFDPALNAAGSSGGSATALACGMAALATGSDTGGSLRNPAAFNGVVGYRPSSGLLPSERRVHGWSCLSCDGPMGRTVADTALMLSVSAGDFSYDPLAYTLPGEAVRARPERYFPSEPIDLSKLRLAATEDFGHAPTESIVRRAFRDKLPAITALFASSENAAPDCSGGHEAFAILRAAMFQSTHGERYKTHYDLLGPNIRANVEEAATYSLVDYAWAAETQTKIYRRYQTFFENFDIIVSPAITISPRPWTELYPTEIDGVPTTNYFQWLSLAYLVTLTGHPCVSIPVGVDERGMPFGLQIVGPRGADSLVLQTAAAIEAAFSTSPTLRRPVPDITALSTMQPIASRPGFMPLPGSDA
ncbi:amidase [Acetobacter nitrogenifigens DSM 23921 = NBRC 105050]|uniref:Amidase n=1 Tax=Acetobacter nitrogenifigens DSM 23921 = NBRC 105050 TaxID=1120919 RepID=A0A511XCX7_9PROT|nr:amidase [Acetobacter nitrogenifigens]GBQ91628.1 amidase [Acetobacter nitrogenifigens DSM 23921 = NBRC 105050]GEN60813.1 amidase [Acetobacter nitrogenifigens DSM 23921 = NBRC 105050]